MKATVKVRQLTTLTAANCRKLPHVRQCGSVGISKDIYPRYTQLPQSRTAAKPAHWRAGRDGNKRKLHGSFQSGYPSMSGHASASCMARLDIKNPVT
jgi:hypothetical protein